MSMPPITVSAHYQPKSTFAGARSPVGRAVSALIGVFRMVATHTRISWDIERLKALSDETLRDIGLHRSEIMSLVHEKGHGNVDRRHARD